MQMKKNEKGITLIALAVMIIIITIIAAVSTYSGGSTIQDSKQKRLKSELGIVQHAVLERYTKYQILNNVDYLVGEKITNIDDIPEDYQYLINDDNLKSSTSPENSYYKLTKTDLEKLDLIEPVFQYIVCYKTGEVMNIDVTTDSQGELLYTSFE